LIDKLDILISENKGDDEYRQLFNTMWVPVTGHVFVIISAYKFLQSYINLIVIFVSVFCEPGNI
jgi:hypothetical protein